MNVTRAFNASACSHLFTHTHCSTTQPTKAKASPPSSKDARRSHVSRQPPPSSGDLVEALEPRSFRRSTLVVSEEFRRRRMEEEERKRACVPKVPKVERKLTQKEMLEEAKRTEIENLKSLEAFTRLEAEKKKVKERRSVFQGPVVRFLSTSMPILSARDGSATATSSEVNKNNVEISVDSDPPNPSCAAATVTTPKQRYCRNFLIFTDTNSYPSAYFPNAKPQKRPHKRFCPITGLPAKYIDPLTGTPYATPQAFKIIRNRYVSEREQKCERRLLQLSGWLEEKKRWLESKS